MGRLLLRFVPHGRDDAERVVEWLVRDDDGEASEGRATAGELAERVAALPPWVADPANVTAFVPAAETLAVTCDVPGRNPAQLLRAAPYAVEEFITEDIETMHVACGALTRGAPVRCLVASQAAMRGWLEWLDAAGLEPGVLTADAAALPGGKDAATVLIEGDHALLRGAGEIAEVDADNLPTALAALREAWGDDEPAPTLRLLGTGSTPEMFAAARFDVERTPMPGSVLAVLDEGMEGAADAAAAPINLLQGNFAAKRAAGDLWGQWRGAAALAGVAVALVLALTFAEGVWAGRQADALRADARDLYRDLFATDRAPGRPARLMRARLGQAPADGLGFHRLMGELGGALEGGGTAELHSVSFSGRNGLVAELLVADYDTVERLQTDLTGRGLIAEIGSSEQREGRVRASLRIASTP